MAIYNVASTVVELIEAATPADAQRALDRRLTAAGFEVLEDDPPVFLSESDPNYNAISEG
ncbi:MAG: hypothetical protein L0H93_07565 [Nocardioides sp.]|nr:hypothetical protein [Nocardioides sp.]